MKTTTTKTTTWIVKSLDVWGHQPGSEDCECGKDGGPDADRCEGYTINDYSDAGTIELDPIKLQQADGGDIHIINAMIDEGYLKAGVQKLIEIEDISGNGDYRLNDKETGEPLYDLDKEAE